ncbi:hypothetical protein GCM10023199_19780 [Actinomycetospora chibensis]
MTLRSGALAEKNDVDVDTSAVDTNADGTFESTADDPNGF